MTDPTIPVRLQAEARMRDLERRVRALERTPILTEASITGYVSVIDGLGVERVRMGRLGAGASDYGLAITGPSGQELVTFNAKGWRRPYYPVPVQSTVREEPTTSGVYTTLGVARGTVSSRSLQADYEVRPNGSTAQGRLVMTIFRGPNPSNVLHESAAVVSNTNVSTLVDLVALDWGGQDPWGAEFRLEWQARRTAGATTIGLILGTCYLLGTS